MAKGIIGGKGNEYTGEQLAIACKRTFGTDVVTPEQLGLVMNYLQPSSYLTKFYALKKGTQKLTFNIPRDNGLSITKAISHRPWQEQIINDVYPNMVVIKARQLGLSEMFIAYMIWWLDTHQGTTALYAFPTQKQMTDFVQMRLNPVFESVPYFNSVINGNNSISVKKIRNSQITFRTSSKAGAVEGVDADIVLLDEYDHVLPDADQSARGSLSSSKYGVLRRWSTPTVEGMGVESLYRQSDQFEYRYTCKYCGYNNMMSFEDYNPDNLEKSGNVLLVNPDGIHMESKTIDANTYTYVCQKCGKPLDRWYSGHWIAKYPERTKGLGGIRGYRLSQMNAVWLDATDLKQMELSSKSKQFFYNYVLGMPYTDKNLAVTRDDIIAMGTPRLPHRQLQRGDYRYIVVGIDWGVKHTIVVAGVNSDYSMDIINDFQVQGDAATTGNSGDDIREIRKNLLPYSPDFIVADIGDSGNKIKDLMSIYGKNKVYGCKYTTDPRTGLASASNQIEPVWNDKNNMVTVDKLVQHKRAISMIKEPDPNKKMVHIWREQDDAWNMFASHWAHVSIREEELENGDTRQVIGKLQGKGDHSASSMVYCLQAVDKLYSRDHPSDGQRFDYTILDNSLSPESTNIFGD